MGGGVQQTRVVRQIEFNAPKPLVRLLACPASWRGERLGGGAGGA
jgi:hypothetical protein